MTTRLAPTTPASLAVERRDTSTLLLYVIGALLLALALAGLALSQRGADTSLPPPVAATIPAQVSALTPPTDVAGELALAELALQAGQLLEPPGRSALDFYRAALAGDAHNTAAQAGMAELAVRLEARAREALAVGDFIALDPLLIALREADPNGAFVELQAEIDARVAQRLQWIDAATSSGQLDTARALLEDVIAVPGIDLGAVATRLALVDEAQALPALDSVDSVPAVNAALAATTNAAVSAHDLAASDDVAAVSAADANVALMAPLQAAAVTARLAELRATDDAAAASATGGVADSSSLPASSASRSVAAPSAASPPLEIVATDEPVALAPAGQDDATASDATTGVDGFADALTDVNARRANIQPTLSPQALTDKAALVASVRGKVAKPVAVAAPGDGQDAGAAAASLNSSLEAAPPVSVALTQTADPALSADKIHALRPDRLTAALTLANERLSSGKLLDPEGDSALFHLRQARALAPNNARVAAGMETIFRSLTRRALGAATVADWATADRLLDAAARLDGDVSVVVDAREQVLQRRIAAESQRLIPMAELTRVDLDPPRYPTRALRAAVEGWALVEFTVGIDGATSDIEVVDASERYREQFARAAVQAVETWSFEARLFRGRKIPQRTRTKLTFDLDD